jgi:heptosyltransferase III
MSRRCLAVHPGALGDVLLASAALAHLRTLGYRPTLAVASRLVPLFEASGLVDAAVDLDGLALHRLFMESPDERALGDLESFDAVVCWMGVGDATFRSNLARIDRPTVVARAAPPAGGGVHVSRHLVASLAALGPLPGDVAPAPFRVAETARTKAGEWLAARGIGAGSAIVLQPGAGSPLKMWPGFAALARRLCETGWPLVTLAGPADHAVVRSLLEAGVVRGDTVARDWALPEIAALFGLARAAVGNDSGPTHLAAAVGCPTVAIFGLTDPAVWAPVGAHVVAIDGHPDAEAWPGLDRVEAALGALMARSVGDGPREPAHAGAENPWR